MYFCSMLFSIGLLWYNLLWFGVFYGGLFVMLLLCKYLVRNLDCVFVIILRIDGNLKGYFWFYVREYVGILLWKK